METSGILLGLLPLVVFVVVDSFSSLKTTLITTSFVALLECIFSIIYFQEIDSVTLFSFSSILLLAFFSYQKKDIIFLKFQPVIFSILIGLFFIVTYLRDVPFLLNMFNKYSSFLPLEAQNKISNPYFKIILQNATLTLGVSFIFHGILTAIIAFKFSKWWWLLTRGLGFYFFMALAVYTAKFV